MDVIFFRNDYPTRFEVRPPLYPTPHAREPWLVEPVLNQWAGPLLWRRRAAGRRFTA